MDLTSMAMQETTAAAEEDRLPCSEVPVKEKTKKITWVRKWNSTDVFHILFIGGLHVLCLFAPSTFSWKSFWVCFALYAICGVFGTTLSFHRNLTHRSFKLPKYLEYFFAYVGLHALQGDPVWWVSTHRYHHKYTDTYLDPHSPIEGFWFCHIFWLFDSKYIIEKCGRYENAGDLMKQSYYRFLERTFVYHVYLQAALLYLFGGFPFIVWGMAVRTILGFHLSWLVNSVCHRWGNRPWNTGDLSTNNWFIAMLTSGEGWHNNHHAFEYSARHGIEWWQIDTTWYIIKLLEYLGLATDIKVPSEIHKRKMSFKN
uniref:Acyl-CoA C20 Delta5-desaturase n=1 Tax=Anemone leveillei TaxID=212809 RepID=AL10_ANELE|nr:RecName: Full=Acyl-CoA C20 Delta5-desaturase; AltName: Full=Acyl-CoA 5-desaturase (non-methylene-interrupted); AltName: Full=Acyl-CoA 5-desaturase AL10 [Anemone leveillei]